MRRVRSPRGSQSAPREGIRRFGSVQVMEPHRPSRLAANPDAPPPKRKRRDALPLDAKWLGQEAVRSLARSDQSRRRLIETLERKLDERCARTEEDAGPVRDAIPGIVDALVDRGYVDDHRLATHLFERGRAAGRSRAQIERQLFAKGIEPSTLQPCNARPSNAPTLRRPSLQPSDARPSNAPTLRRSALQPRTSDSSRSVSGLSSSPLSSPLLELTGRASHCRAQPRQWWRRWRQTGRTKTRWRRRRRRRSGGCAECL